MFRVLAVLLLFLVVVPVVPAAQTVQALEVSTTESGTRRVTRAQDNYLGVPRDVHYVHAASGDRNFNVRIRFSGLPGGATIGVVASSQPNAYTFGSPQYESDDTYVFPMSELQYTGTRFVPLTPVVNGSTSASASVVLALARPPLGWSPRTDCIQKSAAPGSLLVLDVERELVNREEVDGGVYIVPGDTTPLRQEAGRWTGSLTVEPVDRTVQVVLRSKLPFAPGNVREQKLCYAVRSDVTMPNPVILAWGAAQTTVEALYPQDTISLAWITQPADQAVLAQGRYSILDVGGQERGTLVVHSVAGPLARSEVHLGSADPGRDLYVGRDGVRVYRIPTPVRQKPQITDSIQISRPGQPTTRTLRTWPGDSMTLLLRGSGLGRHLKLQSPAGDTFPLSLTEMGAAVTLRTGFAVRAGDRIRLHLTDGRRTFGEPIELAVIEDPQAKPLNEFVELRDGTNEWSWNTEVPRESRTDLRDFVVVVKPVVSPAGQLITQHLILSGELTTVTGGEPIRLAPRPITTGSVSERFTLAQLFDVEPEVLSQAGTVVRLNLSHNQERHPLAEAAEPRRIPNGKSSVVWADMELFGGLMFMQRDAWASPVVGPAVNFQRVSIDPQGNARAFRWHGGLFTSLGNSTDTAPAEGGSGNTPDGGADSKVEAGAGVYIGFSTHFSLQQGTSLSNTRVGVLAGMVQVDGKPRLFLMVQPGALNVFSVKRPK